MTEYDYSPEAFERYLATQQRIARWVDQTLEQSPANPFIPLPPGDHSHDDDDAQMPYSHPPHPAFYATPEGVISPTYSHSRRHRHRHDSSPRGTHVVMPPGYRPVASRSFSTPPAPIRNYYSLPSTPYPTTSSPLNPSPYSSPYQSSPVSFPSYSQASFHLVPAPSHMYANPVVQPQYSRANTYPYFPTSSPEPVVFVNRGEGGYVVLPPPVQHVQIMSPPPVYETQAHSFFGRLKGLGGKRSKSKKSKRSRRDSY
jgi:hypothetical protein